MARIRPPFTAERVRSDTTLVREHFRHVLDGLPPDALSARVTQVREAAAEVAAFGERVVGDPAGLARYVRELNAAPPPLLWWASVAHPPLRFHWSTPKEPT